MSDKFVHIPSAIEFPFVTTNGSINAPQETVEPLTRSNVSGYGYRKQGRRAKVSRFRTGVDCVADANRESVDRLYHDLIGENVYVYQGDMTARVVKVIDIESLEFKPMEGSVGGLFDAQSPMYWVECVWLLQVPYGSG